MATLPIAPGRAILNEPRGSMQVRTMHPPHGFLAMALLIAVGSCSPTPAAPTPAPPARVALTGVVHETVPTEGTRLAGVRVEVLDGIDAGRTGETNAEGRFDLGPVLLPAVVRVSRSGYVARQVLIAAGDTPLGLAPEPTTVAVAFEDYICPTRPDHSVNRCATMYGHSAELAYSAVVHHAGQLRVETAMIEGWDHVQSIWFDIRCQGTVIAEGRFEPGFIRGEGRFSPALRPVFDAPVAGGCRYEVRIFDYGSGSYVRGRVGLRVSHPS